MIPSFPKIWKLAAAIVCSVGVLAAGLSAQPGWTVVMSGLDNPRGLAIGPEGSLYVAEAGRGGTGPCQVIVGEQRCFGLTGAVSRLWKGVQERIISGLPSHGNNELQVATGPHDISFIGRGGAYLSIGSAGNPALRENWGAGGELFGTILQIPTSGRWRVVADIAAFETSDNPAGGPIDSNTFGLLAEPSTRYVADAGGNALLEVSANGDISVVAVFPDRATGRSTDSVPTDVVRGPDGVLYVSELAGVPFAPGLANIWRVVPGSAPTIYRSGLQTVIDLDFGPDGTLYYLQHSGGTFFSAPGQLIHVLTNGTSVVLAAGLDRPTSLLVDDDGSVYSTNHGLSFGGGEVLKINP